MSAAVLFFLSVAAIFLMVAYPIVAGLNWGLRKIIREEIERDRQERKSRDAMESACFWGVAASDPSSDADASGIIAHPPGWKPAPRPGPPPGTDEPHVPPYCLWGNCREDAKSGSHFCVHHHRPIRPTTEEPR